MLKARHPLCKRIAIGDTCRDASLGDRSGAAANITVKEVAVSFEGISQALRVPVLVHLGKAVVKRLGSVVKKWSCEGLNEMKGCFVVASS